MTLRMLPQTLAAMLPGIALLLTGCDQDNADGDGSGPPVDRTRVVTIIKPTERPLSQTTTQPATVHAYQQVEIHAKAAGYVSKLEADIGKTVKPNTVLASLSIPEMEKTKASQQAEIKRLEANQGRYVAEIELAVAQEESAKAMKAQAQSQVDGADAQLKADKAERDRVAALVADNSVARKLLDEAERKYEAAIAAKSAAESALIAVKAQVTVASKKIVVAQKNLEAAKRETDVAKNKLAELTELMKYATLTARIDGVVTERHIDVGDLVRNVQSASDKPRKPLFVIADLRKVRVHVSIPESDAPLVREGSQAVLTLTAFPGRKIKHTVTRTAHNLDPQTRTMLVEIEIENPKRELLPGMYGEVTISLKQKPKALVLPAEAVRFSREGDASIYVLNSDDTVRIVPVKIGMDFGAEIEITEGLNANDRIVGPMIGTLSEGQKVRVRKE